MAMSSTEGIGLLLSTAIRAVALCFQRGLCRGFAHTDAFQYQFYHSFLCHVDDLRSALFHGLGGVNRVSLDKASQPDINAKEGDGGYVSAAVVMLYLHPVNYY